MGGCGIIDTLNPSDAQTDFYEFLQALRLGSRMARKRGFAIVKFTYTYRSSDGQRHSAEIEAESRDAAFARVRHELGVKPIKVVAVEGESSQDGGSPHGRAGAQPARGMLWGTVILAAAILAVALGAWGWLTGRIARPVAAPDQAANGGGEAHPARARQHSADTAAAFKALEEESAAVRRQCDEAIDALNLDLAKNYALIERSSDISFLYDEINKARGVVEWARNRAKSVFKDIHSTFPASRANERLDAQALYGSLMSFVDEHDDRMMRLESALMLLDGNRGKWKCVKGQLVFSDKAVEDEYNFFCVEPDADAARWQRDFGDTGEVAGKGGKGESK